MPWLVALRPKLRSVLGRNNEEKLAPTAKTILGLGAELASLYNSA
jgi:hypothetical protein